MGGRAEGEECGGCFSSLVLGSCEGNRGFGWEKKSVDRCPWLGAAGCLSPSIWVAGLGLFG